MLHYEEALEVSGGGLGRAQMLKELKLQKARMQIELQRQQNKLLAAEAEQARPRAAHRPCAALGGVMVMGLGDVHELVAVVIGAAARGRRMGPGNLHGSDVAAVIEAAARACCRAHWPWRCAPARGCCF